MTKLGQQVGSEAPDHELAASINHARPPDYVCRGVVRAKLELELDLGQVRAKLG